MPVPGPLGIFKSATNFVFVRADLCRSRQLPDLDQDRRLRLLVGDEGWLRARIFSRRRLRKGCRLSRSHLAQKRSQGALDCAPQASGAVCAAEWPTSAGNSARVRRCGCRAVDLPSFAPRWLVRVLVVEAVPMQAAQARRIGGIGGPSELRIGLQLPRRRRSTTRRSVVRVLSFVRSFPQTAQRGRTHLYSIARSRGRR